MAGIFFCHLPLYSQPDIVDSLSTSLVVEQNLGEQLDLDLKFVDENGDVVRLREVLPTDKPTVLMLGYYECPMLCGQVLNGATRALKQTDLEIGDDYHFISVSVDPEEDFELAAKKERTYVRMMVSPGAAEGFHFLTGDSASISALSDAVGFKYYLDPKTGEYAHSAAITLLTPEGVVSRYFFGIQYKPEDLQLGLVEASDGNVGSLADKLVLLCYQYDPLTGQYGFAITAALKIGGILTAIGMISFIAISLLRERRRRDDTGLSKLTISRN